MTSTNEIKKLILWISFFSIAMAFLESAVVVYLRDIYYPEGFVFPMKPVSNAHTIVEILREAATIIMLISVGFFACKDKWDRFAVFLYCFATWDIFYYVFLKLILNWPETLMTWDILFLIPTVWTGPVLSPVISSFSMIILSLAILFRNRQSKVIINKIELLILILGAVVQIGSYVYDFTRFIIKNETHIDLQSLTYTYTPEKFPWWLFIAGEILILIPIIKLYRRNMAN